MNDQQTMESSQKFGAAQRSFFGGVDILKTPGEEARLAEVLNQMGIACGQLHGDLAAAAMHAGGNLAQTSLKPCTEARDRLASELGMPASSPGQ